MLQSHSQPKKFGENHLTLTEQQYFVWDTSSQSTKWQDILEIQGAWLPWPPLATRYLWYVILKLNITTVNFEEQQFNE